MKEALIFESFGAHKSTWALDTAMYYTAESSNRMNTIKKGYRFPRPQEDVTNQNLPGRE